MRWEGRGGAGGSGDYAYPCAWPRPLGVEGVAHPQVQGGVEGMDPCCLRMSLPSPHALWRVTVPFPPHPTPSGTRSLHSRRRQGALTCRPLATSPICCCHLWWEELLTLLSTTHTKGQCPFGKGCTSECWKDLTCPVLPQLVLVGHPQPCEWRVRLWLPVHAATALPQLPAQDRGPPALEGLHVQGAGTAPAALVQLVLACLYVVGRAWCQPPRPLSSLLLQAFNTFIDDVFAFIITMPTAHRVAVFRDDVVFLVYLYQRW